MSRTNNGAPRCKSLTAAGGPCRAQPGQDGYCFAHSPSQGRKRAEARKRGGQRNRTAHSNAARPPAAIRTLADVLALLDYTCGELLMADNSIARARALIALAGEYRATLQVGELETRLAAIEQALAAERGTNGKH